MIPRVRIAVRRHRLRLQKRLRLQNKAAILTGTGESCWANPLLGDSANLKFPAWDLVFHEGKHLMVNHPNRKVPCRLLDSCVVSGSWPRDR
jgi:hypothetical protein